jgi:hypothetical protein
LTEKAGGVAVAWGLTVAVCGCRVKRHGGHLASCK